MQEGVPASYVVIWECISRGRAYYLSLWKWFDTIMGLKDKFTKSPEEVRTAEISVRKEHAPQPSSRRLKTKGGIQESHAGDPEYQQRSNLAKQIEVLFKGFGPRISSYLLTQALVPGGVKRVTTKLDLTSRGRDGADIAQILSWLEKNGSEAFSKRVGIRIDQAPIPEPELDEEGEPRTPTTPTPNARSRSENLSSSRSRKENDPLRDPDTTSHKAKVHVQAVRLKGTGEKNPKKDPDPVTPDPPSKGFAFAPKNPRVKKQG